MKIWVIQTGESLPLGNEVKKLRTSLLADKLVERGHEVLWWASAFDHFRKEWLYRDDTPVRVRDGLNIIALKGFGYKRNVSFSRYIDHRIVAKKFKKLAPRSERPDIIIASTPPHDLAYEAVLFGRAHNIPVIVDIRDPWPDIFLDYLPAGVQGVAKLVFYKDFKAIAETMRMADGLVSVTESFLEWGIRYARRLKQPDDRVFSLGYKRKKIQDYSKVRDKFAALYERVKDKFIVFFVGTLSRSYHNPRLLVTAAEKMKGEKDIHFVIAGDGELFAELEAASRHLENISLTGWLDYDEIEFWLGLAKVGVCPVAREADLPTNKVYSYLSAGLPVVSAFQGEIKKMIELHRVGLYYPPNDIDALTTCLTKLYDDKEFYSRCSENARRVFDEFYDADKIYEDYAGYIERFYSDRTGKNLPETQRIGTV